MFQFIHAADLHLDSPLKGLDRYDGAPSEAIRQATRRALENLVELAIAQKVAFVVIAGDLYDGNWKDFHTGLYFVSQMAKLREAGIPVLLIAGNHDAANKMTRSLSLPENVHFFSSDRPETFRLDQYDVAIHGQSFASGAVLENLSGRYPRADRGMFNLGLLHTSATGRQGHEPYAPCTLDDLRAKQYDYWALGHIHQQEVLCKDPYIVFAGNTQGRHIRETGPKGCLLVTVDNHQVKKVEPHGLDVLRWESCAVDASSCKTGDNVLNQVRNRLNILASHADGRLLAVRVEVLGDSPAHHDLLAEPIRWTNEIRAAACDIAAGDIWVERVLLRTQPPRDVDLSSLGGPLGELLEWIAELRSDPAQLVGMAGELSDLLDKLPPELKEGPDALQIQHPESLCESLDQVEQMLTRQLALKEPAT